METGPWPHLDRRQERGVVWGGRHRFLLEVPANFGELRYDEVQHRRIHLPRTPVDKPVPTFCHPLVTASSYKNHSFEGCAGCLWLLSFSGLGKGRIGLLGQPPSPEKAH